MKVMLVWSIVGMDVFTEEKTILSQNSNQDITMYTWWVHNLSTKTQKTISR